MNKRVILNYLFAIVLFGNFIFIVSCKKNPIGGTGGNNTLVCFPQHHGRSIPGDTIYIKYNAKESPGTTASSYDATIIGASGENKVSCPGLKEGDYYVYAHGCDSTIHQSVYGGIPITITKTEGETDIYVPVTE